MSLVLQSSGGGSVTVNEPTTASNFTQTLPAGTGTVVVSGINSAITSGTAQASTSGTSINFTDIPSWVKRITVMFNGVSLSGTANILIQIGSGSITTSGYVSTAGQYNFASNTAGTTSTAGFVIYSSNATNIQSGQMVVTLLTGNTWIESYTARTGTVAMTNGAGDITLSGTLDRVRITTTNGTDTFDAGTINILYE